MKNKIRLRGMNGLFDSSGVAHIGDLVVEAFAQF